MEPQSYLQDELLKQNVACESFVTVKHGETKYFERKEGGPNAAGRLLRSGNEFVSQADDKAVLASGVASHCGDNRC